MIRSISSFKTILRQTFELLSADQKRTANKSIALSFTLSLAEVLALTALMSILYMLTMTGDSSNIPVKFLLPVNNIPWYLVLGAVIFLFVAKNILGLWFTSYQSRSISNVSTDLSRQRYLHFYQQSWTEYLKGNSAEAIRKIKSVPFDFTTYVLQNYLQLVTDVVVCALMIILMTLIHFEIIVMVVMLCFPIVLSYMLFQNKVISKIDKSFREHTPQTSVVLTQGIDSFAEAKLYRKENFFISLFIRLRTITNNNLADLKTAMQLPTRIFETVGIVCFGSIVAYARINNVPSQETILLIGFFSIALYRIAPSVNRILTSLSQIKAYSYTVSDLRESFPGPTGSGIEEPIVFKQKIELRNILFSYNDGTPQLNHLNLTIHHGDFLMVSGTSGSGKTTLLHLIAGLITEFGGDIIVDGNRLTKETMTSWQSRIGFVSQAPIVLQDSLLNNVLFGAPATTENIIKVTQVLRTVGLDEFVHNLSSGLQTNAGEGGLMLSGGQRQRLVLARALFKEPKVLILDEVTNQLDEENKVRILTLFQTLRESGVTIILASHDDVVKNFANSFFDFGVEKTTKTVSLLHR